jgi:glycosyltransferase involved in cell wall biosynthesis
MKLIGVDASMITPSKAGIGNYALNLVTELTKLDNENKYILFTNDKLNLKDIILEPNTIINEIPDKRGGFWWMLKVSWFINKNNLDIFISPSNFLFGFTFSRTIQIIHDLAPIRFPQFFSKKGSFMYKFLLNLISLRVYKIGVPVETIKNELCEYNSYLGRKIFTTGEGPSSWVNEITTDAEREKIRIKYNLPDKYLLSVSTIEPRKNHINMIKAFAEISGNYPDLFYVIGGKKGWYYDSIFKLVEDLGIQDKIKFIGYIPESDMASLFDMALGFCYCSFYEGFGIPCIEAYSRGLPVLTSDIPVLKEVMGNNAIYANPNDYIDIFSKMLILSTKERSKIDENFITKHTWFNCAIKIRDQF